LISWQEGAIFPSMNLKKDMAKRIKNIRLDRNQTQSEFGRELNISGSSVSGYELADSSPNLETTVQIAEMGNMSLDQLVLGRTDTASLLSDELKLLEYYRRSNAKGKDMLLQMADVLASNN
jgi:transcriptional regulator with XRE-family HTH domain